MRTGIRTAIAAALAAGLAVAGVAQADDYSDPDYLAYDADNMARTAERQDYHLTTPSYGEAFRGNAIESFLSGLARQNRDAADGRVYAGLGQALPGGNVGDPETFKDGPRFEVEFLNREGTKLVGNVWPCHRWLQDQIYGAISLGCPGVVVTTGSIQVTQHMYGWLARHLQANGYTVFTYDVRGQGESETTNQTNPFASNPQDGANFANGTVDALRFFLSSADDPYVPVGMTSDDVDAAAEGTHLNRYNPARASVFGDYIGLIGHSLGANAVTTVQQCTSVNPSSLDLPAACAGERFPIRAIVAYDSLAKSDDPRVPALDHLSDGYFINAVPTPSAPDPDSRVGAGSDHHDWVSAGQDACSITGRGFTHAEWTQIPYIVSATRYGVPQAAFYTEAWLDRYVSPLFTDRRAGYDALVSGPIPNEAPGAHLDHRASLFSGKYRSACELSAYGYNRPAVSIPDLRAYAGVAAVGDWAALNAEAEYGTAPHGLITTTANTN